MRYLIPILGLLLLVFLHELGHFVAAKRTGMRALRFFVGFPPPLLSRKIGDTEYGIGMIPLGGFVKIPGMLRPEPSDLWAIDDLLDRGENLSDQDAAAIGLARDEAARLIAQGDIDRAAGKAAELQVLIDGCEGLSERDRRRAGKCLTRLTEASDPRGYWRSSKRRRLIVIAAGPLANIAVAYLILTTLAATGMPQPLRAFPVVAGIEKGEPPAQKIGLKTGDRIVSINGRTMHTFEQVRDTISGSKGRQLRIVVSRAGARVALPATHAKLDQGRYIIGFFPDVKATTTTVPVWRAPIEGGDQMWRMITSSVSGLRTQGTSSVSSSVGIVRASADAADTGAPYYLWLLAYISLSLGILNLLPFLPLDGGHILLLALERVRGRVLSRATFERVSALGIALVLFLFLFGLHNDLLGAQPR
ncbi:MAG: regulator of sigma protease [Gaiellales bacterium]|nr:regulator of sigma protease [Gaiellales bacterium]